MTKIILSLMMLLVAVTAFAMRPVKRIKFPKGATKVTVSGSLNGYKDEQIYLIKLRAGQTMQLDVDKPVSLFVAGPNGEDASDMDASCHSHQTIENTTAGDYRISAVECKKADAWKGSFRLSVSVSTHPKAKDLAFFTESIEKAKSSFDSRPQNLKIKFALATAYFDRAFALTGAAQYSATLGDFRQGLKLNPNNSEAKAMHDRIVGIYQSMGREVPKEGEEKAPMPFVKP